MILSKSSSKSKPACSSNNPEDKDEIFGVNVDGTKNVMKACLASKVKKVVHVSSVSTLGFTKNGRIKLNEKNYLDRRCRAICVRRSWAVSNSPGETR